MQLTRAADYAVRVMIHLASQPEGAVVPKALLARAAEAPESFLAKILQSLSRAGLIQTRRGVVGGFSLLPRGAEASLLDVVEAIDGPIALNLCLVPGSGCTRSPECAAHRVWAEAQSAMVAVLSRAKVSEMAAASCNARNVGATLDGNRPEPGSGVKNSQSHTKTSTKPRRGGVPGGTPRTAGKQSQ